VGCFGLSRRVWVIFERRSGSGECTGLRRQRIRDCASATKLPRGDFQTERSLTRAQRSHTTRVSGLAYNCARPNIQQALTPCGFHQIGNGIKVVVEDVSVVLLSYFRLYLCVKVLNLRYFVQFILNICCGLVQRRWVIRNNAPRRRYLTDSCEPCLLSPNLIAATHVSRR
jgi:hypothetical protein